MNNQSITMYYMNSVGEVFPVDVPPVQMEKLMTTLRVDSSELKMPDINPFSAYTMELVLERDIFESERAAQSRYQRNLVTLVTIELNRAAITGNINGDFMREKLNKLEDTTFLYTYERMLGFYYIDRVEVPTVVVPYITNTKIMQQLGYPTPLFIVYQQAHDAVVEDYLMNQDLRRGHYLPAIDLRTFNRWE